MMPTPKLDNKLVHRITSIIIQKPRLAILTKATKAIITPMSAIIKQCFTMMPTLKLDNKLVHRTTSIIIQKPRLEIQTKATLAIMATMEILAIMATPIMAIIKQYFTMMPTLKLDNKLVHRITSITTQKLRLEIPIKVTAIMETMPTMGTQIMLTIKQFFTMMPTLKLDNNLALQITSIITLMLRLVHQEEDLRVRHNLHFALFVLRIFYRPIMTHY